MVCIIVRNLVKSAGHMTELTGHLVTPIERVFVTGLRSYVSMTASP